MRKVKKFIIFLILAVFIYGCGGGGGYGGSSTASTNTAPSAPTGVTATAGDGQVSISWGSVSGATSYNIYMATQTGVTKSNYSTLSGGMKHENVTSPYVHTALTNGTTYYFVVTAVNSYGESSESSQVSAMPTVDVTGTWKSADGTKTMTLTQSGTTISGSTSKNSGDQGSISGSISGNNISFTITITANPSNPSCVGLIATCSGTVSGTTMSFSPTYTYVPSGCSPGSTGSDTYTKQ